MAGRSLFSLISLILVAAGLLFMFFVVLAGAVDGSPVGSWYLLEADVSNIPNAPAGGRARWTYWNTCGIKPNGHNNCTGHSYSSVHAAYPLDPASHWTFDTTVNVPQDFIDHNGYYFYMTRFMFAFMLIALFFATCAFFTGILALCTRLGSYLSSLLTMIALVFQAIQASLMTAAYVKGRNNFRDNGQSARVGTYAFAWTWTAFACFFIATVLFCLGGGRNKDSGYSGGGGGGGFRGKRSRSHRSSRSGRFVSKEYS